MSAAPTRARVPQPAVGRDATERLRQAENLAALNILLAGIAHNLANPLTAIGSFLEMLPDRWERSEAFRTVDYQRALKDLGRVQEQIESLTRIAVAPDLAVTEPWKVETLAAELQLYALGAAAERGISVDCRIDCPEGPSSQPREVLKQIMIVLLDNAIAFAADAGTVHFEASAVPAADGVRLLLVVRDNGAGVPSEAAEKIFEPFYSTRKGGMGIGLFVGRQLARAYGGELRLQPAVSGAAFELVIPLAPE
jgi:signal transduction histidine kinase